MTVFKHYHITMSLFTNSYHTLSIIQQLAIRSLSLNTLIGSVTLSKY